MEETVLCKLLFEKLNKLDMNGQTSYLRFVGILAQKFSTIAGFFDFLNNYGFFESARVFIKKQDYNMDTPIKKELYQLHCLILDTYLLHTKIFKGLSELAEPEYSEIRQLLSKLEGQDLPLAGLEVRFS